MIKPIGILGDCLGWQPILDQEKVNYEMVTGLSNLDRYGVLIITKSPESKEIAEIRDYLEEGGAALTDFSVLKSLLSDFRYRQVKVRYVVPTSDDIFHNVGLLDIGQKGLAALGSNYPTVHSEEYGKGRIIALPFDLNQSWSNTIAKPKFFYYPTRKLPYETVAEVSKGEIRKLVVNCLRALFQKQNFYYSHLWYYPNNHSSMFTFRVDTDFSPWQHIESVIKLAQENELSFTWFINTKAQAGDLVKFPELRKSGQDLQLHCYLHNVFPDYLHNRNNISKGKELLKDISIEPVGFAAPFGEWNEKLVEVLQDLNFKYSSEFAFAYDDLPSYPMVAGKKSRVLQIPVHPICVGRLLQADLDFNQIFVYFKRYVELCYQAREPIMIYDHPHRIHQIPQVFDILFKKIKLMKNVWMTNFTQLMLWWKQREAIVYKAAIENGQLQIITTNKDPNVSLHLISPSGQEAFIPLKNGLHQLDKLTWSIIPEAIMVEQGIERIRQGEFIVRIKEFINTMNRRWKGQRS
jgi:hypothetical protein